MLSIVRINNKLKKRKLIRSQYESEIRNDRKSSGFEVIILDWKYTQRVIFYENLKKKNENCANGSIDAEKVFAKRDYGRKLFSEE